MSKNNQEYLALLEQLRWQGVPKCPYCGSTKSATLKKEQRYHCNSCFTSYSATVGTLFHKSRIELSKWFQAIELISNSEVRISVRKLAKTIMVSKNTAEFMITRIKVAREKQDPLLLKIIQQISKE